MKKQGLYRIWDIINKKYIENGANKFGLYYSIGAAKIWLGQKHKHDKHNFEIHELDLFIMDIITFEKK